IPLLSVNTWARSRVFPTERPFLPQGEDPVNLYRYSIQYFVTALLLALLFTANSALAGPPLLCHTLDIGNAKSLPWISHDWNLTGSESYDTKNLPADTIAILDSDPTILVHMETLRRATLYAQKDSIAAKQLLLKLIARSDAVG